MKNKMTIFLLIAIKSFGFIFAQGFIKGEYKSYQYNLEPRVIAKDEYTFDQDMYLSSLVSKSVLDKKWDKEVIVDCENNDKQFVIKMFRKNLNYEKGQNDERTYALKKEKEHWNLFYFETLIGKLSYLATQEECYFYNHKSNSEEIFYSKKNNEFSLFSTKYVLRNGIFYEQDVDGSENYKLTGGNKYEIKYSSEGLESEYKFEKNYYCTDINNTCLLWILRNDINPFLLPYLFCKLDRAYYSTSYLAEGTTTYEPEHLQRKDGLPWASGNGKGIGDIISIKEFEHKNPETLIIMNGYQDKTHPDYYEKNSRVKALKITNQQTKKSKTVSISDTKEEQRFSLTELGKGGEYEFEIVDVYNGNKYDDLCIQYLVVE